MSSGPEGDRLKTLANQLGVEKKVAFWGGFRTLPRTYPWIENELRKAGAVGKKKEELAATV